MATEMSWFDNTINHLLGLRNQYIDRSATDIWMGNPDNAKKYAEFNQCINSACVFYFSTTHIIRIP